MTQSSKTIIQPNDVHYAEHRERSDVLGRTTCHILAFSDASLDSALLPGKSPVRTTMHSFD